MKQSIEQSQFDELSEQARMQYITWAVTNSHKTGDYTDAHRSIGHLIQFIDEHGDNWRGFEIQRDMTEDDEGILVKEAWSVDVSYGKYTTQANKLVDALWEAVKLILEGNEQ